jgi:predicted AlkP superfamily phosphohydrolase/phosphomutase
MNMDDYDSHPDRRDFLRTLAGGAAAAGLALPLTSCGSATAATKKKVIVLGMDGLDPTIVRTMITQGRLPNFKKLAEKGSFMKLSTTMPALSPVAWSSFMTGMTPAGHGIVDFVARNPKTYTPQFAIYETRDVKLALPIGDIILPITGGGAYNLRSGRPFWGYLTERGIPSVVLRIPTDFPVNEESTRSLSGMGTPDVADAYGMFSYFTSDYLEEYPGITGGRVFYVDEVEGTVRAELIGPEDSLHAERDTSKDPYANYAKVPFKVHIDPVNPVARLDIQGKRVLLEVGKYSEWVKVNFELLPMVASVSGLVRFYIKELYPHFKLYATAVNIDPEAQAMPVTHPAEYGAELARALGPFWTKGLPADTKALDYRIIDDEGYVKQAELLLQEQLAQFDYEWSRFGSGFFFFYVSSTDQDAHMLWRNMDETHPMHKEGDPRYAGYLHWLYEQMDALVGKVLPGLDDDTLLLIASDHGFAQFGRQFHLNTWLRDNGYLILKPGAEKKRLTGTRDIDWSKTIAYNIGFNGLYLNIKGREGEGIIEPGNESKFVDRIVAGLQGIVDPETSIRPIHKVYRREEVYSGPLMAEMPEMLVGYTPGYRVSSDSAMGSTGKEIININPWAWSGDHSMSRVLVPGTLFSNKKVAKRDPNIIDLPVSILEYFGVPKPKQMVGNSIFKA